MMSSGDRNGDIGISIITFSSLVVGRAIVGTICTYQTSCVNTMHSLFLHYDINHPLTSLTQTVYYL